MKKVFIFSVMMLSVILLASCGEQKIESSQLDDAAKVAQQEMLEKEAMLKKEAMLEAEKMMKDDETKMEKTAADVTFDISGENFSFSQSEIRVTKGQTVTINFESASGFHDLVIDEFDAATDQVKPGTPTSVTFVADEAGEFEFYCSVGNHKANGMLGTLIVEEYDAMMKKDDQEKMVKDDAMMKDDETKMKKDDAMMDGKHEDDSESKMEKEEVMEKNEEVMVKESAGIYADYDNSMLGKTENTVIFFHAAWCPSCRAADAGISTGTLPDNLTVLKADFDSEIDLRKKYSVVGQHTFVQVDADGNEIKKWLGGNDVASIVERLQ